MAYTQPYMPSTSYGSGKHPPRRGSKGQRATPRRDAIIRRTLVGITNALVSGGMGQREAEHYSRLILSRPGVTIRPHAISYQGKRYSPADFATSKLARFVTGALATARNKAAITGEAGYQQALAELGLQRDLQTSGLEEQRRRSILDFGDPGFAGSDSLLGAQAASNPLSTARLLQMAYQRANAQTHQTANLAGTLFGGGLQSGLAENQRINAGQQTEATRSLEDLLAGLSRQRAQAEQIYSVGNTGALRQAEQRLLASGMIHAAKPPNLKVNDYRLFLPWRNKGKRFVTV